MNVWMLGLAASFAGGGGSAPPVVVAPSPVVVAPSPVVPPSLDRAALTPLLTRDRRLFNTGMGLSIGFGAASAGLGAWGTIGGLQYTTEVGPPYAGASAAMTGANVGGLIMGVAAQRTNNRLRQAGVGRGTPRGALAVAFGAAGAGCSAVATAMFASSDYDLVGWGVVWGLHGVGFAATSIGLAARDMSASSKVIERYSLSGRPAVSVVPTFDLSRGTVGFAGTF
jgi:hypothetical protein